jgi:hypothetical protein
MLVFEVTLALWLLIRDSRRASDSMSLPRQTDR